MVQLHSDCNAIIPTRMMRPVIHCFMPVNVKETAVTADSPERRRLPMLLRRAWYGLNQAFRRRIAHLKLTPDQFTVMRTLLEHEGISQRELTTLMSSDPNTVASLLERMEKAGFIERHARENDRRTNCLRVKVRGRDRFETARDIAMALQNEVLSAIPVTAREQFLTSLDRLSEACRAAAVSLPKSPKRPLRRKAD